MGDFDFNDRETGGWGSGGGHRGQAKADQGFEPPHGRSPLPTPPGWYGGAVRQTGGMTMAREWDTIPDGNVMTATEPSREHEYRVAYDQGEHVALDRYEWWDDMYAFDERVDSKEVPGGRDMQKAEAARRLMQRHSGLTTSRR